jgi:hypothetical protein
VEDVVFQRIKVALRNHEGVYLQRPGKPDGLAIFFDTRRSVLRRPLPVLWSDLSV